MKFATIAVIAIAATTAEAKSCGKLTTASFTDAKCTKPLKGSKALVNDLSTNKLVDVCTKTGKTSVKTTCDGKTMSVASFTDAKCATPVKGKAGKVAAKTWGTCVEVTKGKVYVMTKGAEALKMAVTGAALALVASQF